MREFKIRPKEFATLGTAGLVEKMKAVGFVFDRETCPIELRPPWDLCRDDSDGSISYRQWDAS